jgi:hypothetical protein
MLKNTTLKLSVLVVFVCCFRFLFDGITLTFGQYTLSLGHVDSLAYGAILTPILGAHGYIRTKLNTSSKKVENEQ